MFELVSAFSPAGDQPQAIAGLTDGLRAGARHQTLLGVTGSGKTFTIANVIRNVDRPTLVISHNKTLAAQLYAEFKGFFPSNAVEYFVSYFDYYQPEAYIPRTDTFIEKDSSINEEIERLRLSTMSSLFARRDVIVVASVSCIYGIGSKEDYEAMIIPIRAGQEITRDQFLSRLVDLQYTRNDIEFTRGQFRVRGDTVEICPASTEDTLRVEFFGDQIDRLTRFDPLTGNSLESLTAVTVYPGKQFVTTSEKIKRATLTIREELTGRIAWFEQRNKLLEAQRVKMRTEYDLEMMLEMGFCSGIENYSRHLSGRPPGSRPCTLLDFFPPDYLLVIDESHATIPQLGGMYAGDRSRKTVLVDYGFRLPSALDNRPLNFDEFQSLQGQAIYVSATPGEREIGWSRQDAAAITRLPLVDALSTLSPSEGERAGVRGQSEGTDGHREAQVENSPERSFTHGAPAPPPLPALRPPSPPLPAGEREGRGGAEVPAQGARKAGEGAGQLPGVVEQIVRPTGLVDPPVTVKPLKGQIDDLIHEARLRVERKERVLVTTLTKRTAEELADYLRDVGVNVRYLHSEIDAIERVEILRALRKGDFDVLVGINLLREGLDIPEVSLVAILDADKEGYLRSTTSLVQTAGRAARHLHGEVILYADVNTRSIQNFLAISEYRRQKQVAYNLEHHITPRSVTRAVEESLALHREVSGQAATMLRETGADFDVTETIRELEAEMLEAANHLEFEKAALLRDQVRELKRGSDGSKPVREAAAVSYPKGGRTRARR